MSHISKIKTQMVDKELILQALGDIGCRYEVGNFELEGFKQQTASIEIKVISRLGNDIGLRRSQDAYEIVADWWGVVGSSQKEFTAHLTQRYAYLAVTQKLAEQGFTLASEEAHDGKLHLILRRVD